jgi:hypothetical protein
LLFIEDENMNEKTKKKHQSSLDAIRLTSPNKSPRQLCLFHRCPDADDDDDGGAGISSCFQRTATARVTAGSTLKATAPLDRFFSLPFPVPLQAQLLPLLLLLLLRTPSLRFFYLRPLLSFH